MIHKSPGCAAKLLQEVKSLNANLKKHDTDKKIKAPALPKKQWDELKFSKSLGSRKTGSKGFASVVEAKSNYSSYPSSPKVESPDHQIESTLSFKQRHNEQEHDFFTEMLKAKLRRVDRAGYREFSEEKEQIHHKKKNRVEIVEAKIEKKRNILPRIQSPTRSKNLAQLTTPKNLNGKKNQNFDNGNESPELVDMNLENMSGFDIGSYYQNMKKATTEFDKGYTLRAIKNKERAEALKLERQKRFADSIQREISNFEAQLHPRNSISSESSSHSPSPVVHSNSVEKLERSTSSDIKLNHSSDLDVNEVKRFFATRALMNPVTHTKTLAKLLPESETSWAQSRAYLDAIRVRKIEEEESRNERDQRRRKILLRQQNTQVELEREHLHEIQLQKLMRQSKQERRIAEQLMQVRHEKEVMRSNRIYLEEQFAKRRQQDYEEALQREFILFEREREEYKRKTQMQMQQHREILQEQAEKKHAKNIMRCESIVHNIIDLSLKVVSCLKMKLFNYVKMLQIAEYRALNDLNDSPPKLLHEWKTLFMHDQPLELKYLLKLEEDKIRNLDSTEKELADTSELISDPLNNNSSKCNLDSIRLLDEQEFHEYLDGLGDWSFNER
ncbi:Sperm flagellar protein 2 [Nowakowskiella sp. JEL0078]|nr:Sperm flagellar protein 2 [Nowakowskiella sp. JEL0078]